MTLVESIKQPVNLLPHSILPMEVVIFSASCAVEKPYGLSVRTLGATHTFSSLSRWAISSGVSGVSEPCNERVDLRALIT